MELLETVGQRLPDVLLISVLGWCLYKALFEDLFTPRASRARRAPRPPGALYMLYWRWRYRVLRFGQRRRYALVALFLRELPSLEALGPLGPMTPEAKLEFIAILENYYPWVPNPAAFRPHHPDPGVAQHGAIRAFPRPIPPPAELGPLGRLTPELKLEFIDNLKAMSSITNPEQFTPISNSPLMSAHHVLKQHPELRKANPPKLPPTLTYRPALRDDPGEPGLSPWLWLYLFAKMNRAAKTVSAADASGGAPIDRIRKRDSQSP
jgi:hypothetical protein